MGTVDYRSLLSLLDELSKTLENLTAVEQDKTQAVRQDNLAAVNECMKREQVLSLSLRGLDQKREAALAALELSGVPLGALAEHLPEEYRLEAIARTERLRQQYRLFQGASEVARSTLECNLHQVEKVLGEMGGDPEDGPGYRSSSPVLPPAMRTDFRA